MKIASTILIFLYDGIRPLLGPATCKFPITCGEFARQKIKQHSFGHAILAIMWRVLRCNPFTRSYQD